MATASAQLGELDRISARIMSLSAEKARIDAEIATSTEELRRLFEDRVAPHPESTRRAGNLADTTTATEVACLLRVSERSAHQLVQKAALLVNHHPRTLEALRSGDISWAHASALVHEYAGLPEGIAAGIEETLLPIAVGTSVPRLSYRARRLRAQLHPVALEERARNAAQGRRVELEPADDAMAWLHVHLPATDAAAIDARLTGSARSLQTPGERRTLPQLRADILTDLLLGGCTCPLGANPAGVGAAAAAASGVESSRTAGLAGRAGEGHGPGHGHGQGQGQGQGHEHGRESDGYRVRAHINVTVPVLTLLGVDDAPADLEGYGPIPADVARRLAAHAPSFTRLLTHPETGAVLSVGRSTYTVPADLRKWLRVRDRTCRHPGCSVPASRCELDHTTPWSRQGTTSHSNLAHLCRKHHMLKSEGIWHYEQLRPGVLTAISPAGRTYVCDPEPPPF